MIRLLLPLVVVTVILAAVMVVGGAAFGAAFTSEADRKAGRPSRRSPTSVMTKAWLVSAGVVIVVGIATEGIALVPALGICAIGLLITHLVISSRTNSTPTRGLSPQEIERARLVEEFGADGVAMLDGAKAAIDRITRSEAATGGWLGDPQDLDFTGELATIRQNCRATRELDELIKELSDLAAPDSDDLAMLADARTKVQDLESRSRERVNTLQTCAEKAEQIDQSLRDDRAREALARKRDDVRARLAAKLYGVDATPSSASSSVDQITALAAAYAEIKGNAAEPGAPAHGNDTPTTEAKE